MLSDPQITARANKKTLFAEAFHKVDFFKQISPMENASAIVLKY